ncbi:hypothetical protein EJ06DRAFT_532251 [Trichodelitschia bisporula]|uniref:Uncharacterized protein n=1 Tax=Trichodelitschia bisporula TaxID=703511 RepID=A0A6G1HR32_9PEZI|nr:hypothetical protein EJ06DRAFT_532251 [Trichodelitschia bisporula]
MTVRAAIHPATAFTPGAVIYTQRRHSDTRRVSRSENGEHRSSAAETRYSEFIVSLLHPPSPRTAHRAPPTTQPTHPPPILPYHAYALSTPINAYFSPISPSLPHPHNAIKMPPHSIPAPSRHPGQP